MTRVLVVIGVAISFFSCSQSSPKIKHEAIDTLALKDDRIKDTTKILVSELPVKFDSTDVILFPIRLVDQEERGGYREIASGSYTTTSDVATSYLNKDNLRGNFINIVFQEKHGNERKLTDKKIEIRNLTFLRDIFRKTKSGYLLYSISDRDSNGDKELDSSDLEALYISGVDGSDFKKITKELHEFYDWTIVRGENKIYFRTLEDRNKDGKLNNKDIFHYYFIDFSGEKYSVIEYNPIKIFGIE